MNRETVYAIIDQEREYQDKRWGSIDKNPHEVGSWILMMEDLLADARKAWQRNGDLCALNEIRKVVAVGIATLEAQEVIPTREGEERKRDKTRLSHKSPLEEALKL